MTDVSGRLSVALVHYPVLDRHGGIQTTALTNLDAHDMARSTRTYNCAAFYLVTPVTSQQEQARAIVGYWEGERGQKKNKDRTEAMSRVQIVWTIEEAIEAETKTLGKKPLVVVTSARPQGTTTYTSMRERMEAGEDVLLLFGTGHGLADRLRALADVVLAPVLGPKEPDGSHFNHLSVRSAAAIILDRLRGS